MWSFVAIMKNRTITQFRQSMTILAKIGGGRMSRYIDADKLYELIRTNDHRLATINGSIDYGMFTVGIKQAIDEIPTADVAEVKRGEWTKDDSDGCFCSFCGWYTDCDNCNCCGKTKLFLFRAIKAWNRR